MRHGRHHGYGIGRRFLGVSCGLILGVSLIVSLQLPFSGQKFSVHIDAQVIETRTWTPSPLVWPAAGSAAVGVPEAGVVVLSVDQPIVPIASLTKMMTAWVALHLNPLTGQDSGPCITVTPLDVAELVHELSTNQSHVKIYEGEEICERDLLRGLLVHSANNYAHLLERLTKRSDYQFVREMNQWSVVLGLTSTHYVDASGVQPQNVSTAGDQLRLAERLMAYSEFVRATVALPSVSLPFAGIAHSYTPLVGTNGVVGVKSGRTGEAGGCDVMARRVRIGSNSVLVYGVVLSQHVGDVLANAGRAALQLTNSVAANVHVTELHRGSRVGTVGWSKDSSPLVANRSVRIVQWGDASLSVHFVQRRRGAERSSLTTASLVGDLYLVGDVTRPVVSVVPERSVSRPTLWQRLR